MNIVILQLDIFIHYYAINFAFCLSDVSWDGASDVKIFTFPKEIKDVAVSNGGCKIDEKVRHSAMESRW